MTGKTSEEEKKDIETNKTIAAIGYLWILCLLPLFFKKESKFAQFHGKQGFVLFLIEIFGGLIYFIPIVGMIFGLLLALAVVSGFSAALSGKYWEMPVIGPWAKKLKI